MNHVATPLLAFLNFEEMTTTIINGNKIFLAIRIVVVVIGAVLGWFISSPLWSGLYWLATRKAIPWLLSFPLRLAVAGVVGAALFFFLPLGGMGGFGLGPGDGPGLGKGKGPGEGPGNGTNKNGASTDNGQSKGGEPENGGPEKIDIVLLGGKDYKVNGKFVHGEGKYYKVKTGMVESVLTLKEVEKLFAERKNQVSVVLHITEDSVEGPPLENLREYILQKKIKLTYPSK